MTTYSIMVNCWRSVRCQHAVVGQMKRTQSVYLTVVATVPESDAHHPLRCIGAAPAAASGRRAEARRRILVHRIVSAVGISRHSRTCRCPRVREGMPSSALRAVIRFAYPVTTHRDTMVTRQRPANPARWRGRAGQGCGGPGRVLVDGRCNRNSAMASRPGTSRLLARDG
jgi:hypothetical protein